YQNEKEIKKNKSKAFVNCQKFKKVNYYKKNEWPIKIIDSGNF
ncbi:41067_t:CDS:1, partial [Gigaspora margarita]